MSLIRVRSIRLSIVVIMLSAIIFGPCTPSIQACPFCSSQGQTLSDSVKQAGMILFGTMGNAKQEGDSFDRGTTDLTIDVVIKDNAIRAERKVLTLPRYIPPTKGESVKYLIFCDVYNGKVDPYRGIQVPSNSPIGEYLQGAVANKDKDAATRLKYFLGYLDSKDPTVSTDAYQEFANADYKDFQPIASKIDPAKVISWLKDESTPSHRYGLYGSMLGHCGKPEHVAVILECLTKNQYTSGIDGLLAGYILLDPKAGFDYLVKILGDPKTDFLKRYAGLRTLRFFHEYRHDVMSREQLLQAIRPMLEQDDISDMPIEDLRKWQIWDMTKTILGLYDNPKLKQPIVRRAILRFALSVPKPDEATLAFLSRARAENPERVKDIEEGLQLEKEAVKPTATPAK